MHQDTSCHILEKATCPHTTEARLYAFHHITQREQRQYCRTHKSEQHRRSRVHPRSVGKHVYRQSYSKSPKHKLIARCVGTEFKYQIDIKERRGIAAYVHIVQYEYLQQYQTDKPAQPMYIIKKQLSFRLTVEPI